MLAPEDLITYVTGVHARTYEAVERLRDEDLHWRPGAGEFTAGELVMHIANSRLMNAGSLATGELHYRGHALRNVATALTLRQLTLRTGKKTIAGLIDADLTKTMPAADGRAFPAWRRVIAGLVGHETHHRSQLCEYLRAMGLEPPPLFGLHAEDLPR